MATLDKAKSYGVIVGDNEGRCFEQGGKYFDSDGSEHGVAKPKPAKAEAKTEAKTAPAAVEAQLAAQ